MRVLGALQYEFAAAQQHTVGVLLVSRRVSFSWYLCPCPWYIRVRPKMRSVPLWTATITSMATRACAPDELLRSSLRCFAFLLYLLVF